MKNNIVFLILANLVFISCNNNLELSPINTVSIADCTKDTRLSSFLKLEGYTVLHSTQQNPLRELRKVIFKDGQAIVLDGTEFQSIYTFDERTGVLLRKIGRMTESDNPETGYKGLLDITFNPQHGTIRGLSAGHLAFVDYRIDGSYLGAVENGVFGDDLEYTNSGGMVVYNEHNSTVASGLNYLLFYDKDGNLVKRLCPYTKEMDNMAYEYTGYLVRSGDDIWFNPPFCDTIYQIYDTDVLPRFVFDFGRENPAVAMIKNRLNNGDFIDFTGLNEGFYTSGHFAAFPFTKANSIRFGFYDLDSKVMQDTRESDKDDPYYPLVQFGQVYYKDFNTFCLAVPAWRIQWLMGENRLNEVYFNEKLPGFVSNLRLVNKENNDLLLLYFSFNQDATFKHPGVK